MGMASEGRHAHRRAPIELDRPAIEHQERTALDD
jgi:hypothetical protein